MIASVKGEVVQRRTDYVTIACSGIGYRLEVSDNTLKKVPGVGSDVQLFTQMVVREDSMTLYGFASEEERDLFNLLVGVSGIGPKVAVATLSGGGTRELVSAIAAGDIKRFQAVPGVGKKTAERIVMELRDKVGGSTGESALSVVAENDPRLVAREGLLNLGYTLSEAEAMLDSVAATAETAEEIIAAALRRTSDKVGVQ